MYKTAQGLRFSASDLVNFSACPHLTRLDRINLDTPLPQAEDSEEMTLIAGKGLDHEARYWAHLQTSHNACTDLSKTQGGDDDRFAATVAAMRRGDHVLFQATLLSGPWLGHADFLLKVDTASDLGDFSYEVADTKLARQTRAKFLIQLCLYAEMIGEVQGRMPRHMHVVLGDGRRETFQVNDYLWYFRRLKQRFLAWVNADAPASRPERCERCGNCRWRDRCADQWKSEDHLNQVANITRLQMFRLKSARIDTVKVLASLAPDQKVAQVNPDTLQRLAHQARLQVRSRTTGQAVYELLPSAPGRGFARLPEPDEGDLFFDMEGNPLEEGGLEYLFGVYYFDAGNPVFRAFWAHTRREERTAFEAFIDFVTERLARYPRAHVYHYAPYEPTALKRLMSAHGTRENQVDDLLRNAKLVDLYAVVREGMRVGESSYSIKAIERFYWTQARSGDVKTAGASVVFYERWKATRDPALLTAIESYNADDVRSTWALREWLLSIRPAGALPTPATAPAPVAAPTARQASAEAKRLAADAELERLRARLTDDLPDDPLTWTAEQRLRELMFQLLSFHRRCDKPVWWALFARQQASEEELLDDLEVLAGLEQVREPEEAERGMRYFFRFPEQETKLKSGDNCCHVASLKDVVELEIDEEQRTVSFVIQVKHDPLPPRGIALGSGKPLDTGIIQNALRRFVTAYLDGRDVFSAGLSFLRRSLPAVAGVTPGSALLAPGESLVSGTSRVVAGLNDSHLFIQGPPGAGKTYTGSHVIVDLLQAGKRVAVASNSHKAINNLLHAVEDVATERGFAFVGAKKSSSAESCVNGRYIADVGDNQLIVRKLGNFQLLAGTAWLFSNAAFTENFDYLFIDEAGQVSVANLIAMSTCARNLVLLGDQMQLGQPIQGVHPGESGLSALDYLLQGEATISPSRGIFLKDTWRMHPDVCRFISDAVYDGRLEPAPINARQRLVVDAAAAAPIRPTGISFIDVDHDGCSQRSEEEAQMIRSLVERLLGKPFVDKDGQSRAIGLDDILVVAPYNMQVNRLKQVLPPGARVGTVDKFQGQEAAAVLVSMTTSNDEYLPRDIEFLYSKNRLNVAVSRARCWVGVVASPQLLDIGVATATQMGLVNTLCWLDEYSRPAGEVSLQPSLTNN